MAKAAQTVACPRASYGASDPRPEPRYFEQNTVELGQLIAAAKLAPPFV